MGQGCSVHFDHVFSIGGGEKAVAELDGFEAIAAVAEEAVADESASGAGEGLQTWIDHFGGDPEAGDRLLGAKKGGDECERKKKTIVIVHSTKIRRHWESV